jgi:hypothetical protein
MDQSVAQCRRFDEQFRGFRYPCDRFALIRDTELMDTRETLIAESKAQEKLMGTPNQMEAVMAGMQKRKAEFRD